MENLEFLESNQASIGKGYVMRMNDAYKLLLPMTYSWVRSNKFLYVGKSINGVRRLLKHHVIGVREEIQEDDLFAFWPTPACDFLEETAIRELNPKYNQVTPKKRFSSLAAHTRFNKPLDEIKR